MFLPFHNPFWHEVCQSARRNCFTHDRPHRLCSGHMVQPLMCNCGGTNADVVAASAADRSIDACFRVSGQLTR